MPAAPVPQPLYGREVVAEGLERLRAHVVGASVGTHEAPVIEDLTAEQARAYAARYSPNNAQRALGRSSGGPVPQCGGCKRFLKHHGAQCESCGYLDGGGYMAVPAKTSHLERWR